jgi:hypothetical protein
MGWKGSGKIEGERDHFRAQVGEGRMEEKK